jgi:hypothetical protein
MFREYSSTTWIISASIYPVTVNDEAKITASKPRLLTGFFIQLTVFNMNIKETLHINGQEITQYMTLESRKKKCIVQW